jgi:AcrR family transcriptional regulator
MTETSPIPVRSGRPRNQAIDDVVLDATIRLLSEHGFHGVSMDDIAAEAHTGKDTLYRRWPSRRRLVTAALDRLVRVSMDALPTGSADGLSDYFLELDRLVTSTPFGHVVASTVGEAAHDPEMAAWLSTFWEARRAEAAVYLDDGNSATGHVSTPEQAVALDLLFGALLFVWFVDRRPITRPYIQRLARAAAGLATAAIRPSPSGE